MENKWVFGKREKILLFLVILFFVLLVVKSLVLDPYTPQNELEEKLAEEALDGLETEGLLRWRVIAVNDLRNKREGLQHQKVVELRRYVLYIFPFGQRSIFR
ncbi:MAG TPA: hypothetical protein GX733_08635 [Tissierellia bacterium]|nr:hypothetical protein [Tissierellia bacterium]